MRWRRLDETLKLKLQFDFTLPSVLLLGDSLLHSRPVTHVNVHNLYAYLSPVNLTAGNTALSFP